MKIKRALLSVVIVVTIVALFSGLWAIALANIVLNVLIIEIRVGIVEYKYNKAFKNLVSDLEYEYGILNNQIKKLIKYNIGCPFCASNNIMYEKEGGSLISR